MTEQKPEGWFAPTLAKKRHYFKNGHSLCSAYVLMNPPDPGWLIRGDSYNPNNCMACRHVLKSHEGRTA